MAQTNETVIEPVNDTIIAEDIFQHKNEIIILNATFLDSSQKNGFEELFVESQNNFDRSLSILNMVATLMAVLVALITIFIMVAIASGYFERTKWIAIRNDAQNEVNIIKDIKKNFVNDIESMRKEIPKHSQLLSDNKPSKEVIRYFNDISSKLELAELLGVALSPEDFSNRATDFYYKEDYHSSLSIIEKGIELYPDDCELWMTKSAILAKLGQYQEGLESTEKSISLDPNANGAWCNKGALLQEIGRYDEAIIAYEKSLALRPEDPTTLFNLACCYSLMEDKKKMLDYLGRAIARDPTIKENARTDTDLEMFFGDEDFKNLIE